MDLADRMAGPSQMEEIMSQFSRLSAALATTSVIVLSASAADATINIPKPIINVPRPTISVAVPKPTIPVVSTPISSSVRPSMFAGKPATVQNTVSNWQGPAGAGTQSTSMIYQNGKLVGAISAISKYPATTAPKPGNPTATPANNHPITPGTVQIGNHPATPAPTQTASHPAAPAPTQTASHPAAPAPAAKPKITFTPVEYPAFTDQYGTVKGYYVNGKLVTGLTGPTGGTCSPTIGYQTLGGGGSVSSTPKAGMVSVKAVQCYIKS